MIEFISETLNEEKVVEIWPEYPSRYDVKLNEFKDQDKRELFQRSLENVNRVASLWQILWNSMCIIDMRTPLQDLTPRFIYEISAKGCIIEFFNDVGKH